MKTRLEELKEEIAKIEYMQRNCNHEWKCLGKDDDTANYRAFWVPSCPGDPWPHSHWRWIYQDIYEWECKKCGAGKDTYCDTHYGPEQCDYDS